jgi:hypothetical protein
MITRQPLDHFRTVLGIFVLVLMLLSIIITSCRGESSKLVETPEEPPALANVEGSTPATGNIVPESIRVPSVTTTETADRHTPESAPTQDLRSTITPEEETEVDEKSSETTVAAPATATLVTKAPVSVDYPEGALISILMEGQVGVLLDELPELMRDRVVESLLERSQEEWQALVRRQVRLTSHRLNFRNFVYSNKGQLPLPPEELWSINLEESGPVHRVVDDHELVTINYVFTSTLLTDASSPADAEPALGEIGGTWDEPFILPLDPDQLLQRTGNACINEAGFPPSSFDSENAWVFFDFDCDASSAGPLGCHRSQLAEQSCADALVENVGTIETAVRFERLEWDPENADQVRRGEVKWTDQPDLQVVGQELANNRITYRYFLADSCALLEQCVSDSGWRRLLQFDAVVHNVGGQPLHIGPVVASDPTHNLFQYNACHDHFHFSDYGDFVLSSDEGEFSSKQAFCVESTNRLSNNEYSPLTHDYNCRYQGIQSGWIDEYHAGLDCQWIDITDVEPAADDAAIDLGFLSNPDQFLCEGSPILDDDGLQMWEPSGLTTADGRQIERPQCNFVPDWEVNNYASQEISIPTTGTFVTESCNGPENGGHLGPNRNCGFTQQFDGISFSTSGDDLTPGSKEGDSDHFAGGFSCEPGQPAKLSCSLQEGDAPQAIRLCEFSHELGAGLGCVFKDALATAIVGSRQMETAFLCPSARDEDEPGGRFSLYTAPLFGEDETLPVTCSIES